MNRRDVSYLLVAVHDLTHERRVMGTYALRHLAMRDGRSMRHDERGRVTPWGYHVERVSVG